VRGVCLNGQQGQSSWAGWGTAEVTQGRCHTHRDQLASARIVVDVPHLAVQRPPPSPNLLRHCLPQLVLVAGGVLRVVIVVPACGRRRASLMHRKCNAPGKTRQQLPTCDGHERVAPPSSSPSNRKTALSLSSPRPLCASRLASTLRTSCPGSTSSFNPRFLHSRLSAAAGLACGHSRG
jgi:hypothetical protein